MPKLVIRQIDIAFPPPWEVSPKGAKPGQWRWCTITIRRVDANDDGDHSQERFHYVTKKNFELFNKVLHEMCIVEETLNCTESDAYLDDNNTLVYCQYFDTPEGEAFAVGAEAENADGSDRTFENDDSDEGWEPDGDGSYDQSDPGPLD